MCNIVHEPGNSNEGHNECLLAHLSFCPTIRMFQDRETNNKINKINERASRLASQKSTVANYIKPRMASILNLWTKVLFFINLEVMEVCRYQLYAQLCMVKKQSGTLDPHYGNLCRKNNQVKWKQTVAIVAVEKMSQTVKR